jgi:hypothetical protein
MRIDGDRQEVDARAKSVGERDRGLGEQTSLPRRRRRRPYDPNSPRPLGNEETAVRGEGDVDRRLQAVRHDFSVLRAGVAQDRSSRAAGRSSLRQRRHRDAQRRGSRALEHAAVGDEGRELERVRASGQRRQTRRAGKPGTAWRSGARHTRQGRARPVDVDDVADGGQLGGISGGLIPADALAAGDGLGCRRRIDDRRLRRLLVARDHREAADNDPETRHKV